MLGKLVLHCRVAAFVLMSAAWSDAAVAQAPAGQGNPLLELPSLPASGDSPASRPSTGDVAKPDTPAPQAVPAKPSPELPATAQPDKPALPAGAINIPAPPVAQEIPQTPDPTIPPTTTVPDGGASGLSLPDPASTKETATAEVAERHVQITPPRVMTVQGPPTFELLEQPVAVDEGLSLMFTEKDMFSLIIPSLALFDRAGDKLANSENNTQASGDDLTGLLESLKVKGDAREKEVTQPLPNIYLGSIVYYDDANWSVWINGKKLTNMVNAPTNPIFVESVGRNRVTLVWKPNSMLPLNKILNSRKIATPENLQVEESSGRVIVTLMPNQTFVPSLLAVLEGMVSQKEPATAAQDATAAIPPENATSRPSRPAPPAAPPRGKFSK